MVLQQIQTGSIFKKSWIMDISRVLHKNLLWAACVLMMKYVEVFWMVENMTGSLIHPDLVYQQQESYARNSYKHI